MPIYFYRINEKPYGCFSNFSRHGFELDGHWWPTSEHYFQSQKFWGTPRADEIRQASTPMEAARLGRKRGYRPRPDWDQVKDDVMRQAVWRKFACHADIRAILLATGDELIIERTTSDDYWGCGARGTGQNKLGLILMATRDALRQTCDQLATRLATPPTT